MPDRHFFDRLTKAVGCGNSPREILLGQQNQEFLATVAIDLVADPARAHQCARHEMEHLVSGRMALVIVVSLEVIDVTHDGAVAAVITVCLRANRVEILAQLEAVAQPGQRIRPRLVEKLAIELREFFGLAE